MLYVRVESLEFRHRLLNIVRHARGGVAKEAVMKAMMEFYPPDVIARGITEAIHDFAVDQLVDYAPSEGEFEHTEWIWYLKVPNSREAKKLRALKPVALALLRLLYEQDTPRSPGEIKVKDARTKLVEMGYAESETEFISVRDRVGRFWTLDTGQREDWYYVIPEYKKTPRYKAAMRRAQRKRDEKEAIMMRLIEEDEKADERRERRRARDREKRLKRQSTDNTQEPEESVALSKEQSLELREKLLDIVRSTKNGLSKEQVKKQLESSYAPDLVDAGVRQAIDEFLIEQVIDYSRREGVVSGDLIWYLRALSGEEEQKLRSLKPAQRALLKLMHCQGDYDHLGQMTVEDARTRLAEVGFPLSETKYLSVEGRVDVFWRIRSGEQEEWFRIIPEYEKTAEYRAAEEEAERELDEHVSIQTYMTEKLENEDEKRRKRAESREKRTKQQST